MSVQLKFVRPKPGESADEERCVIVVARETIGEIRLVSNEQRPIWIWRIVIAGKVVANGAAFTLAAAKSGSQFAWQGYGAKASPAGVR